VFIEVTAIGCAALAGMLLASGNEVTRRLGRLFPDERSPAAVRGRPRTGEADAGSATSVSALVAGVSGVPARVSGVPTRVSGSVTGVSGAPTNDSKPAELSKGGRHRSAVSLLAGFACALLVGGPVGWVGGILLAIGCRWFLARMEPRAVRARRARIVAELPIVVDLLAACLRGGGAWHESVEAVADAVGGPLGEELSHVAARIRLGADPAAAWLAFAHDPVLAPLGRAAARAASGGAPLAATLARLARDQRRAARAAAAQRARSAGVRAVAPLGLCFLPAFILLGILPAVAGIAAAVLLP
jgi:Flp pilus assembly protein TadB